MPARGSDYLVNRVEKETSMYLRFDCPHVRVGDGDVGRILRHRAEPR